MNDETNNVDYDAMLKYYDENTITVIRYHYEDDDGFAARLKKIIDIASKQGKRVKTFENGTTTVWGKVENHPSKNRKRKEYDRFLLLQELLKEKEQ